VNFSLHSDGKLYVFYFICPSLFVPLYVHGEEFYFDAQTFKGYSFAQNLEQFNQDEIPPGEYQVDVYVNEKQIKGPSRIKFKLLPGFASTQPCFTVQLAREMRIKSASSSADLGICTPITYWVKAAKWEFDQAALRLKFIVPEADLIKVPRGYVPPSEWDKGISAFFIRHNTNYVWSENRVTGYTYDYLWSGITGGFNVADWQLRHQGNLRMVKTKQKNQIRYDAVRTWVQHPVPALGSIVMLGDNTTDSSQFGSLAFNGFRINNDKRMFPQSQRSYAPEVRGIASTTARVVVSQSGKVIYETTVSPGPFRINDLYNTKSQGDLKVDVFEANGKHSSFTVPYSSVPESVRPGFWNYSISLGRVRQFYQVNNYFFEGLLQRGISNQFTVTTGARLAADYQAWLLGGVFATRYGAVGFNAAYSDTRTELDKNLRGWRAELSYSKSFVTGTNVVLAAYRYSTKGYRDLPDVLGVRRQYKTSTRYTSDTLHQKNSLSMTLSQNLRDYGIISLSASTSDYYGNKSRISQMQLGYSNSWRNISYSLNFARQRTAWNWNRSRFDAFRGYTLNSAQKKTTENTVSLNVSIPLDWGNKTTNIGFSYNQSGHNTNSGMAVSGPIGGQNKMFYSLYGGVETMKGGSHRFSTFGGSIQRSTSFGGFNANYAQGFGYRQAGIGMSGTMLIHSGGLTLGPYTGETFALIHADGAEGSRIFNGQGAEIDWNGYGILPSLMPYQENTVSLDASSLDNRVELRNGSQRIVPYAGAIGRLQFLTLRGQPVLINLTNTSERSLPMGAEVRDAGNTVIGIVGQGGQLYARVSQPSGVLEVSWGKGDERRCFVSYQITGRKNEDIVMLNGQCKKKKN